MNDEFGIGLGVGVCLTFIVFAVVSLCTESSWESCEKQGFYQVDEEKLMICKIVNPTKFYLENTGGI